MTPLGASGGTHDTSTDEEVLPDTRIFSGGSSGTKDSNTITMTANYSLTVVDDYPQRKATLPIIIID